MSLWYHFFFFCFLYWIFLLSAWNLRILLIYKFLLFLFCWQFFCWLGTANRFFYFSNFINSILKLKFYEFLILSICTAIEISIWSWKAKKLLIFMHVSRVTTKTYPIHKHRAAYLLNQSKINFEHCYLKICARKCNGKSNLNLKVAVKLIKYKKKFQKVNSLFCIAKSSMQWKTVWSYLWNPKIYG